MIGHMLVQTATVYRLARVGDGEGGWKDSFSPAVTLRCRATFPTLGRGTFEAAQETFEPPVIIYFEPGADVQINDRIMVSGAGSAVEVDGAEDQADGVYRKALAHRVTWRP